MMEKKSTTFGFVSLAMMAICVKVLLIPSYTSTDFEVHRNWLAITYNLPMNKWYFEDTSQWTLDYPPFFAWFEKLLSQFAAIVDPEIVSLSNLEYKSNETLYFQRGTVIISDLFLAYSSYKCREFIPSNAVINSKLAFFALMIFNCGLLVVDHIHFQYNGFLFAMLFMSLYYFRKGNILMCAFWFIVLLHFKHIFLYIAPAFGVFLFRIYCLKPVKKSGRPSLASMVVKLISLASIVLLVTFLSLIPFVSHFDQLLKRLFPFKRGLTHAYWAPNVWALYNAADRVIALVGKKFGFVTAYSAASSTGGLVHTVEHIVLPSVPPFITFVLTFLSMVPCLLVIFFRTSKTLNGQFNQFLQAIILCSLSSFLFGWHVHEKAILMAILPFTLLAFTGNEKDARLFLFLQAVGHYSLFPLLFNSFETVIKICLAFLFSIIAFSCFSLIHKTNSRYLPCLSAVESLYLFGLFAVEIFCNVVFPLTDASTHLAFLPLMLTSVYCAFGVVWSWLLMYKHIWSS